ncbi:hypothetical protein JW887_03540 [Candidatus Dojkabacteria bacterium]|nr:hypothetical protein [Candidatus Dojkabacteria bacterium]
MNKDEIVLQTKIAFDFLQKLYVEVSYLIKEIEGLLAEEEEEFLIGKPGGYQITSRGSQGLDVNLVMYWLTRFLSVFFVPKKWTRRTGGRTTTKYSDGLKVIQIRVVLDEKDISEPYIYAGVIYDIVDKQRNYPSKFEELIRHIEYNNTKIFTGDNSINYEDAYTGFKGNFFQTNLYEVNTSEDIINKIITPVLEIFRAIE